LTMQARLKALTGWIAIIAIALQAIWAGLADASTATAAPFDPAAIICHSDPGTDADRQAPAPVTPAKRCTHCVLCNTLVVGIEPDRPAALIPLRLSHATFVPCSSHGRIQLREFGINLPRAPPCGA